MKNDMTIYASHKLTQTALLLCALLLSGCGIFNGLLQAVGLASPPPEVIPEAIPLSEQPMSVTVRFNTDAQINPDFSNRPSPARARIFMTDSSADFLSMPVEQVFELGDSTLDIKPIASLTVIPGQSDTVTINSVKSNDKVTVAVAFRDPYSAQWIQSLELSIGDKVEVSAQISPIAVTLSQP